MDDRRSPLEFVTKIKRAGLPRGHANWVCEASAGQRWSVCRTRLDRNVRRGKQEQRWNGRGKIIRHQLWGETRLQPAVSLNTDTTHAQTRTNACMQPRNWMCTSFYILHRTCTTLRDFNDMGKDRLISLGRLCMPLWFWLYMVAMNLDQHCFRVPFLIFVLQSN